MMLSSSTFAEEITVPWIRGETGILVIDGVINNRPAEFMFDTGATTSVLTTDLAYEIEDSLEHFRIMYGIMADGKIQAYSVFRINELRIGDKCIAKDTEAAIIPGADRNILGVNVIREFSPVTINFEGKQEIIFNCE